MNRANAVVCLLCYQQPSLALSADSEAIQFAEEEDGETNIAVPLTTLRLI
jgi:hypothetical protein